MVQPEFRGAIEAGGTKFVCMVGADPAHILAETRLPTTSPQETLPQVIQFFKPFVGSGQIKSLGIGSFGPLDLRPDSPTYGWITSTPKPGWQNVDLMGLLKRELDVTVALDTDVNAAALGEQHWGAGQGYDPILYLTIGTGIGGGYILGGKPLHGLLNPEMGHLRLPHDRSADPFNGVCPFHGDCLEGLASGPAITKRFGLPAEIIPDRDPFWELEAGYIGSALTTFILTLSPERIILGGGVMHRSFLFPLIRQVVREQLKDYLQHSLLTDRIDEYILPPGLGDRSGILGAIALAGQ